MTNPAAEQRGIVVLQGMDCMRGLIPLDTKFLVGTEPPQRGGVLNPLANKQVNTGNPDR